MWTAQQVLDNLIQHRAKLRELSVRRIGIFGSYGRGEASRESDLDFVVVFEHPTFDNYANLNNLLEDLFGCKVDLVPEGSIKPALLPHILSDVTYATGI